MSGDLISRAFNGVRVHQRTLDGYINLNQMADATGKRIDNWLQNQSTIDLLSEFKAQQNKLPGIPGSLSEPVVALPGRNGGTWAHPDIAIQFAQWCSPAFALQVSRWVREWMTTGRNPLADIDRVGLRDDLKDNSRLRMTNQVKTYLEDICRYDDKKYRGRFFADVHDAINKAVCGETAKTMRERLSKLTGKKITENDLIRDYFPSNYLQRYIAICEVTANLMISKDRQPLTAVEEAAELVLPADYVPKPINFVEHINLVRGRIIEQLDSRRDGLYRSLADK